MLSHHDILQRVALLAEGGWHPSVIALYWWSDTGWELHIGLADWIAFGTPRDELPVIYGLPVEYNARPDADHGLTNLPPGVSLLGGSKAPAYVEAFDAPGYAWQEQAEAAIREVWRAGDGDDAGDDRGYFDLRDSPYHAQHSWARCRVWRWMTEQDRAIRETARLDRGAALLASMPTADQPIVFRGRRMSVYRPCGCITDHYRTPGKGRSDGPQKRRFGGWLAERPCLRCHDPSSS